MNCKEAKQISIVGYLQSRGINPAKNKTKDFWYCSPLHSDETPSFKVDTVKNLWYDHGSGKGGNIIDLVAELEKTDTKGVLQILSGTQIAPGSLSFHQQKEPSNGFEIESVQTLQNRILMNYIESRGIPSQIAALYVKEAHWKNVDQTTGELKGYFGVAFKNDIGGYELNYGIGNRSVKLSTRPKGITTIPGSKIKLNIFEGFFDFLSFLVYSRARKSSSTAIVLNSVSNLNMVFDLLPDYENVNLYLDNDTAGREAAKRIIKEYPLAENCSERLYPDHKDFNDFLINRERSERKTTASEANTK